LSQPNLTLCMIIRNEQEMLPDFLSSVAGLWDEFVVADTGSTDASISLLEAAGARVLNFPWGNDFSAARNASLDEAHGRWIIFLDADERPGVELVQQIRALVSDSDAGAATVILRNEWPDGTRQDAPLLRLFHNHSSIRFQYPIHEDISTGVRNYLKNKKLRMRHLPGVVQHLGYLRENVVSRDKKNRDLELLRQSLQIHPRDFYCWFKILEIARFWDDIPLWQETALKTRELLAEATSEEKSDLRQRQFSGEMAALVAQKMNGSDEDRLKWLDATSDFAAASNAWLLRRGLLLENLGRLDEAGRAFGACLENQPEPSSTIRPRLGLCRLALARGDAPQAAEHVALACAHGPINAEALLAAVTILPLIDPENQPRGFLDEHLARHPEAGLDLARALIGTGQTQPAADILSPLAHDNAEAAFGFLLCSLVLDQELDLQVDVEQDEADRLFKLWIHLLWKSRKTETMEAFAQGCGAVTGIFPWLPEYLAEETRLLSN
jgi:tetratricopeptide (TPR) repeat protein